MQFTEDKPQATYTIQGYGEHWVQVQNQRLMRPFIISAHRLLTDWEATSFEILTAAQLEPLFALNSELILFGYGSTAGLASSALYQALVEHKVGFEIMATDAACRTYTILLAEGRNVAAALFP